MAGFFYLATPYRGFIAPKRHSTGEAWGPAMSLQLAFDAAAKLSARLLDAGVDVYSPIAHSHPIAPFVSSFDGYSDKWLSLQEPFMSAAKGLLIGLLPGWCTSSGVAHEWTYFIQHKKPVCLVDPDFISVPGAIQR
jgi:hypothetical protein